MDEEDDLGQMLQRRLISIPKKVVMVGSTQNFLKRAYANL